MAGCGKETLSRYDVDAHTREGPALEQQSAAGPGAEPASARLPLPAVYCALRWLSQSEA